MKAVDHELDMLKHMLQARFDRRRGAICFYDQIDDDQMDDDQMDDDQMDDDQMDDDQMDDDQMDDDQMDEIVEIMTENELQRIDMDAKLQVLLQQSRPQIQVVDEVSIRGIRGCQDMIKTFLEQSRNQISGREDSIEDLLSLYSVEIFVSSRVQHVEIMQKVMWRNPLKGSNKENQRRHHVALAWRLLIPYRFISNDDSGGAKTLPSSWQALRALCKIITSHIKKA
jgi:hypothetical protein